MTEYTDESNLLTKAGIYIPTFEMITPVSMDYRTWDLEPAQMVELMEARKDAGIHRIDTWNFDRFICGAIVNGLIHTELTGHVLYSVDGWKKFKEENPKVKGDSFEEAITFVATSLSKYHQSSEAFAIHYGADILIQALETFLGLFPYLKTEDENIHGRTVFGSADDYLDSEQDNDIGIKRHYKERELFAVSWSDSVRLSEHLSGIFAIGFKILSEQTHTRPVDIEYEEWTALLLKISEAFKNYYLDQTPLDDSVKEVFVSRFPSFWD